MRRVSPSNSCTPRPVLYGVGSYTIVLCKTVSKPIN
eukprot:COSAG01_NODE_73059_length_251_cov_0.684211_1_plen_35_part_10